MTRFVSALLFAAICSGVVYENAEACAPPLSRQVDADRSTDFRSVTFEFLRRGLPVPHWTIEVQVDGSGVYIGSSDSISAGAAQPIRISTGTQEKLHAAFPIVRAGKCETKMKHIAETGQKTVSYAGIAGVTQVACTFNFSDNDSLNALGDAFLGIAQTMQAGDRLAQKHRYDRLGLDAELDAFTSEVKAGRATEIGNIAPVLQAIMDDERLMERVQRKAARLLQDASAAAPTADSAR